MSCKMYIALLDGVFVLLVTQQKAFQNQWVVNDLTTSFVTYLIYYFFCFSIELVHWVI